MSFIWTLYVLWAAVNAYFSDGPPSERFQELFDSVTTPRHITVGKFVMKFLALALEPHQTPNGYSVV